MAAATTTSKKKKTKKKTTSRSKAKTYSKEELDAEIARKEAEFKRKLNKKLEEERLAREAQEEEFGATPRPMSIFGGSNGSYNELGFDEEQSPEEIQKEQEQINSFDIFEWIQTNYINKGTAVVYQVKKDNAILGEFTPPLSWSQLQEEHGGGVYTITAKHALTKKYLKQDTKQLLSVKKSETPQTPPIPQGQNLDVTQLLTSMMGFFQQTQSEAQKVRDRQERNESQASQGFNTAFVDMLNSSQTNTMNMLKEIQNSTMTLMSKMQENTNKLIEKQNDKMDKMFWKQANTKSDEGPSWLDVMKMTKDAEKDGWDRFMKLQEWTEAKAEELAESRTPEPQNDSSMTGTIIKSLLPMFTGGMNQAAQQRGPVSPPQLPSYTPTPSQQPLPGTHQAQASKPRATRASQDGTHGRPGAPVGAQTQKNPLGLPTFTDEHPKPLEETMAPDNFDESSEEILENLDAQPQEIDENQVAPEPVQEVEVSEDINQLFQQASGIQQQIASQTIPSIAKEITNPSLPPGEVARLCLLTLRDQGITGKTVLKEFPFDFMIRIAKSFGLDVSEGSDNLNWLKEFYVYIENTAGVDATGGGEQSPS